MTYNDVTKIGPLVKVNIDCHNRNYFRAEVECRCVLVILLRSQLKKLKYIARMLTI